MNRDYYSLKKLLVAYTLGALPFAVLMGLLSMFHVSAVYFNGEPTYGVKGFALSIICAPFFGLCFGLLTWIVLNTGMWVLNIFSKR